MSTIRIDPGDLRRSAGRYAGAATALETSRQMLTIMPVPEMPPDLTARARAATHRAEVDFGQQREHCARMAADLRRRAALAVLVDAGGPNGLLGGLGPLLAGMGPVPGLTRAFHMPVPLTLPAGERLKVPNTGRSGLDLLLGRNRFAYPEDVPQVLENGGGGQVIKSLLKRVGVGAGKSVPLSTRLAPGGGLRASEGAGRGHTLAKHVGKTNASLRRRLAQEPRIPAASSYNSRALAEDAVSGTVTAQRNVVQFWLRSGKKQLILEQEFDRAVGRSVIRETGQVEKLSRARTVLVKDSSKLGYHVKTSYPAP